MMMAAVMLAASPASAERLTFDHGRLFIAAEVNGVRSEALLDSGAEAGIVDPKLARLAGLPNGTPLAIRGSGGSARARVVEGVEIKTLNLTLHPDAVVVTDLTDISKRLAKREVQFIVGREIFDAARLRLDILGGTIDRLTADSIPTGTKLALTDHAGIEAVPAVANGVTAHAEFDLGNGTEVLISRKFANALKLKPVGRSRGGGIGGEHPRDVVRIDRLEVAGVTFHDVRAFVDDESNADDLNIGTAILKNFIITTDFAAKTVWLDPRTPKRRT